MLTASVESKNRLDDSRDTRQRLLELARQLDRFGRQSEEFICRQLEQLERAVEEFERERDAWRRQLRRETAQLARQREELDRLRQTVSSQSSASPVTEPAFGQQAALDQAARRSGIASVRLLLQPQQASPLQVGVLLFEISKLNRDMGGPGVTFELAEVRMARKGLLSRNTESSEIYEFHGGPAVPLKARGNHVVLDPDNTDRVENWIAFKSQLLRTSLVNTELAALNRRATAVTRTPEMRAFAQEATRRKALERSWDREPSGHATAALYCSTPLDIARQQVLRLESCCERLSADTSLRAHVALSVDT